MSRSICIILSCCALFALAACALTNPEPTRLPSAPTPLATRVVNLPIPNPLVKISNGALQGVIENNIAVFKGIPYAAAPVGALRWRAPQPVADWNDVRRADAFGAACFQPPAKALEGAGAVGAMSEDCLYANVWTPNTALDAKLPVMVWIHGGALLQGAGSLALYDGGKLAERGAVIVTFNYRLGPLGFFSHPALDKETPDGPVNFGLLDEIAALQWTQKNIAAFGGDPRNVTIFGESAGAQSVLALFASPLARGLFQRGIAQSAYGIPSHPRAQAQQVGIAVASAVGLDGAAATASALRATPAEKFAVTNQRDQMLAPSFVIGDAALPQPILETFQQGGEAPAPLIIGNNSDEATVVELFGIDPASLIDRLGAAKIALKPLYPGVTDNADLGRQVIRDLIFTAFAKRIADAHAARAPSYRYYFSYLAQKLRGAQPGVSHGGEIVFVFDTFDRAPLYQKIVTDADRAMAQRVGAYWFEFARTGVPAPPNEPVWAPSTKAQDAVMEFGDTIALQTNFMKTRLNVFVGLLDALGKLLARDK